MSKKLKTIRSILVLMDESGSTIDYDTAQGTAFIWTSEFANPEDTDSDETISTAHEIDADLIYTLHERGYILREEDDYPYIFWSITPAGRQFAAAQEKDNAR